MEACIQRSWREDGLTRQRKLKKRCSPGPSFSVFVAESPKLHYVTGRKGIVHPKMKLQSISVITYFRQAIWRRFMVLIPFNPNLHSLIFGEITATPFFCETPAVFCGLKNFTQPSIGMRGEYIMTEFSFLGELFLKLFWLYCTVLFHYIVLHHIVLSSTFHCHGFMCVVMKQLLKMFLWDNIKKKIKSPLLSQENYSIRKFPVSTVSFCHQPWGLKLRQCGRF